MRSKHVCDMNLFPSQSPSVITLDVQCVTSRRCFLLFISLLLGGKKFITCVDPCQNNKASGEKKTAI
ncbi:unnamed protein product [Allacma fusca]|uniref:Uncharacterized protein n=1 Tax=Allacma fusca TaxID=39272 RepID=A0A8J2L6R1_9HEXA|nr:unnamed protein product [Allacma fusca]